MESRWEGNGHVQSTVLAAPGEAVWRFKIDGEQRTVITTHFDGGLKVSAIDENAVLWSLPHVSFKFPTEALRSLRCHKV